MSMDLKRIKEKMIEWGVDPAEADDFMSEFDETAQEEAPKENVSDEAKAEGGEPEEKAEAENKQETEGQPAPAEGGEPSEGDKAEDGKDRKISELESQIKDLKDTLEGFSASQKRLEELVGSLGTKVAKERPFGEIKSSTERDADKSGKASAKATMSAFAEMAGRR